METTKNNRRLSFNISGEIFETYEDTLTRFAKTLLGEKKKRDMHYCLKTEGYFFNRNRECFQAILYYYQSRGTLNCPKGIPIDIFENECRYFQLPEKDITEMKVKEGLIFDLDSGSKKGLSFKVKIWNILENPETSRPAKLFGVFSLLVVWISIVATNLETTNFIHSHSKVEWKEVCYILELILNSYFLIELILRIIFSENKLTFFYRVLNWIDIVAVVPYFILLVFKANQTGIIVAFKALKVMRVMRLFRLTKLSVRINIVMGIIKASFHNLRVLCLCFTMVIFIGGTFIFYVENLKNPHVFTSIPESLWWATQTITSVGYGDMVPATVTGRVFTCCFMLFGAVTISLPVLTMISRFMEMYDKNLENVYMH